MTTLQCWRTLEGPTSGAGVVFRGRDLECRNLSHPGTDRQGQMPSLCARCPRTQKGPQQTTADPSHSPEYGGAPGRRLLPGCGRRRGPDQSSRTNVTIRLTWYSTTLPPSTRTCCSLIQALRTLRSVSAARAMPWLMASSKLFPDVALISVTRATDMA